MPIEENRMIARARDGEPAALNELVVIYWPPIYRLALSRTGNPEDAQEITQDTFLRALGALPRYKETNATFTSYLSRIALNLITDYYRKRGRTLPTVDIAEYPLPLIDTSSRPEEALLDSERREEVVELLAFLPEEQRRVVELRILQGVAVADAARILGKSSAAVKMLQQRALKKLRDLFVQHGIMEGGGTSEG